MPFVAHAIWDIHGFSSYYLSGDGELLLLVDMAVLLLVLFPVGRVGLNRPVPVLGPDGAAHPASAADEAPVPTV